MPHDLFISTPDVVHLSTGPIAAASDTSHIFKHAFLGVDSNGAPPPIKLPAEYAPWQDALRRAKSLPLRLGDISRAAEAWRQSVREVSILLIHSRSRRVVSLNLDWCNRCL